ncbi:MAG TPA: hypothetical protein VE439_02425 [Anaerolineae bacterium]|nr:hypothetical protein [Anaerolineae bacterium]
MKKGLFLVALLIVLVLMVGCGYWPPTSTVQQPQDNEVDETKKLPDSVTWKGYTFTKTDHIYKYGEVELKKVGEYKGYTLYETRDIGYNEKFIKNQEGDFVLYKIKGALVKKPNIYLYPEKEEAIKVSIQTSGRITQAIPEYRNGWEITAAPGGKIGGTLDFLYYEAMIDYPFTLNKGWITDKLHFNSDMNLILREVGLNNRERRDFLDYWSRELTWEKNRYAIYYLSEDEIGRAVKLSFSKKPDSILRVYFYFMPVDGEVKIEKPIIPPFVRNGFTVVEWGGLGQ